jgi:hypothetical protein
LSQGWKEGGHMGAAERGWNVRSGGRAVGRSIGAALSGTLARALKASVLVGAFALLAGGVLLMPSSAHAAPDSGNYQVSVLVTNGPFSYGGSTLPQFQATLTALNGTTLPPCSVTGSVTGSVFVTISIDSDPGTYWAATSPPSQSATTCVYTYINEPPDWSHYATGSRIVTAHATVSSQIVATGTAPFVVNKVVTSTSCFVNTPGTNFQTGGTLQIAQSVQGPSSPYTPNWMLSTFGVTFTGPASVTYTLITPDTAPGTGWLYVQAPTLPGHYTMTCTFDGYGEYAPSTSGGVGVDISAFHPVGAIELYTNPTTYNPLQSCDMYIVIRPAPGGPMPTGYASIVIGRNTTPIMTIASNGTLSVHLGPLPLPSSAGYSIQVAYNGDAYYRWSTSTFSFTNPAIPGGGGTVGSAPPTATPVRSTASPTASTTATASPTATGTAGSAGIAATQPPAKPGNPWPGILLASGATLLLGGGSAAWYFLAQTRKRSARMFGTMPAGQPAGYPPPDARYPGEWTPRPPQSWQDPGGSPDETTW